MQAIDCLSEAHYRYFNVAGYLGGHGNCIKQEILRDFRSEQLSSGNVESIMIAGANKNSFDGGVAPHSLP
jgi:hypothetical protein